MSGVDGELDDRVTDVCLRLPGGQSLFRGPWERDVEERGNTRWREERVATSGHLRRRRRNAIL